MKNHNALKTMTASALLATVANAAWAHDGHGLTASTHWHATDAWGFVALAGMIALALWFSRGGK